MHFVIVALLVVIVLILLGMFGPLVYTVVLGVFAMSPVILTALGVFVAGLVVLIIWHAANGTL